MRIQFDSDDIKILKEAVSVYDSDSVLMYKSSDKYCGFIMSVNNDLVFFKTGKYDGEDFEVYLPIKPFYRMISVVKSDTAVLTLSEKGCFYNDEYASVTLNSVIPEVSIDTDSIRWNDIFGDEGFEDLSVPDESQKPIKLFNTISDKLKYEYSIVSKNRLYLFSSILGVTVPVDTDAEMVVSSLLPNLLMTGKVSVKDIGSFVVVRDGDMYAVLNKVYNDVSNMESVFYTSGDFVVDIPDVETFKQGLQILPIALFNKSDPMYIDLNGNIMDLYVSDMNGNESKFRFRLRDGDFDNLEYSVPFFVLNKVVSSTESDGMTFDFSDTRLIIDNRHGRFYLPIMY